ncbi:MAG: ATPase [Clostridia bacterium]|nr:ATPase [Clostridia bacterium]
MARHYFLGGNTPQGFYSYYDYLIDAEKAKKAYVIKGGPGTGKSTLMKSAANWGEDNGYQVDFLHCSSDPNSLDGIIIDGDIAMVDGTSPHTLDPKNPGCVEKIINMGDFWDEARLRENKEKIIEINKQIKECFASAYNYLAAAGCIYKNIHSPEDGRIAKTIFDEVAGRESVCGKGKMRKLFASAIGPAGTVSFADTLLLKKCYVLKTDFAKGTSMVMKKIAQIFLDNGYDTELFYDPLAPDELIEHICVPEMGASVLTSIGCSNVVNENAYVIDVDEIMNISTCGKDYIHNKLMTETLIKEAAGIIAKAKQKHDELESCYIPCMDFESANKCAKRIIEDIRNNKTGAAGI